MSPLKLLATSIFALTLAVKCYGQENQRLAQKITGKMCDCVGQIDRYERLKSKLDSCYDRSIDEVATSASAAEIKIIGNPEQFTEVKRLVSQLIKTDCEVVKAVVVKEARPSNTTNPYPTNFTAREFDEAKASPADWDGKVVAFDGKILEIKYIAPDRPYYKIGIDGSRIIWLGSMVNQKHQVDDVVRYLGYFSLTDPDGPAKDIHQVGFHIIALGEIDHKVKRLAFTPGSESQMKEWGRGQVPAAQ